MRNKVPSPIRCRRSAQSLDFSSGPVRNFQSISKSAQAQITTQPDDVLKAFRGESVESHRKFSISVFDHWLSRDECIAEIDNTTSQGEFERNHRLHLFCIDLAKSNECYVVKLRGRKKEQVTFRKFTSEKGLVRVLEPKEHSVGDNWRFVLSLPKLKIVYLEGSDFTHHVYHQDSQAKFALTHLARIHGLHVIDEI